MRILWLKTELLHPVDKGGKIRSYQMLKELKQDHHVTYLTLDDGSAPSTAVEQAREYCQELVRVPHRTTAKFGAEFYSELAANLFSSLPYAIEKYASAGMRDEVAQRVEHGRFDVVVCDFLALAGNVPAGLCCPTVLFQHNVEAVIWRRLCEVQKNAVKKIYFREQWRKMRNFEAEMCRQFGAVVAVSVEDRETMSRDYNVQNVFDIPTGVDVDYFRPSGRIAVQANNLVFTGSMDWLPNEDGIRYFIEEILPLVRREVPDVTLTVVGRDPYPALVDLSKRDRSVLVTGRVEDVRPYMERACGYIVPLRIGGGTRLKIYEAMAMGKTVVSTTVGAEGLPVKNGEELILADGSGAFASAVVKVLTEPELAARLGERAASTVREKYGWKNVAEEFALICKKMLDV